MDRTTIGTALLFMFFLSGCDISGWRYRYEQPGMTPSLRQLDQLQCQNRLTEEDKLQYWWVIDGQIGGCMREKGYRYVEIEAIIP
jgi:hypothetical protein